MHTTTSSDDEEPIPIATLVTIADLQSEAGKRLNGGSGIILGRPSPSVNRGVPRYPVFVYALLDGEGSDRKLVLSKPPMERSIKAKNLRTRNDKECELFRKAAFEEAAKALGSGDATQGLFWGKIYHECSPDDVQMNLNYANLLRTEGNRPEEAWEVLQKTLPNVPLTFPMIDEVRYDACLTCCKADGNVEEALSWALSIGTDGPGKKKLSVEALRHLAAHCRQKAVDVDADAGHRRTLEVHRRAARELLERDPLDANALRQAAAAECLLGDHREGARLYRRAVAAGQLRGEDERALRNDLALAQMQCPGGPMEHYRVVGVSEGKWACVDKRDKGSYSVASVRPKEGELRKTFGITSATPDGTAVRMFRIPDPDDREAYGSADIPPIETTGN